jgi:hypothetical protein
MRSRILPAVGVSAIALVAAAAFAPMASAHQAPGSAGSAKVSTVKAAASVGKVCYSQGTSPSGFGISSQDFESASNAYDDTAADDFKVGKKGCKIKTVAVSGFYSAGVSSTTKANVTFYKDASGKPGAVIKAVKNAKVSDDTTGNFTINLGKKVVKLKKGTTWVSVQAVLNFSTGGQWYWAQATDGGGADAQWQNPNGGFGVCPSWDSVVTCNGATDTAMIFSLS